MTDAAHVTEPATLLELGPHLFKDIRKVLEAMCSICLFHNIHFQKLLDQCELTHGGYLLNSMDFLLRNAL